MYFCEKDITDEINNFATRRFSALKIISGHVEGIASDKNTLYQHYVCIKTYLYVLAKISAHNLEFLSAPSLHREYYHTL